MAMDEKLAATVRAALADAESVREVKMFGGLGFMLNGNMVAATSDRGLLVRVGAQGQEQALAHQAAQLMKMNGMFGLRARWIRRTWSAGLAWPACSSKRSPPKPPSPRRALQKEPNQRRPKQCRPSATPKVESNVPPNEPVGARLHPGSGCGLLLRWG